MHRGFQARVRDWYVWRNLQLGHACVPEKISRAIQPEFINDLRRQFVGRGFNVPVRSTDQVTSSKTPKNIV
jgi:hypothetical protein